MSGVPVGWFVFVCTLSLASNVVLVLLFLRQFGPLLRAVVAKNSTELAMTESVAKSITKPARRLVPEYEGDFEERTPRPMGLG